MSENLTNRCVLITGASSGIGKACAEAFAAQGCRLLLAARRKERLDELSAVLRERHGAEVLTEALDVRDREAVERWVDELPGEWSDVDILVNNAGLARGLAPLHEGDVTDWEEMIDTNLKGLLWVTRAVLPGMIARGHGHVINIGSIAGHEVYPGGNVYCGTKHAVRGITGALRLDLLGSGVRVCSVDPGMVETEFSEVRFHGDRERAAAVYRGTTALSAQDVAEVVYFAASRPDHVDLAEVLLLPTDQASATSVHRRE
jgi:3-hydroxy acid dehydrogenase/malonic semialdehyde reductase